MKTLLNISNMGFHNKKIETSNTFVSNRFKIKKHNEIQNSIR